MFGFYSLLFEYYCLPIPCQVIGLVLRFNFQNLATSPLRPVSSSRVGNMTALDYPDTETLN